MHSEQKRLNGLKNDDAQSDRERRVGDGVDGTVIVKVSRSVQGVGGWR